MDEDTPCVVYGHGEDSPIYYRVCPICKRFVKADDKSTIPEHLIANATCKIHGRIKMPFCTWNEYIDEEDNP